MMRRFGRPRRVPAWVLRDAGSVHEVPPHLLDELTRLGLDGS